MIIQRYADWLAEAKRLFGDNVHDWKFVCPVCCYVQSFAQCEAAGMSSDAIAFSCIGRWLGSKREAFTKDSRPGPCNYAGGGLFKLNPVRVVMPDGVHRDTFDFFKG